MKRLSIGLLGRSLLAAVLGLAASVDAAQATTLILSDMSVPAGGTFTITVEDPGFDPTTIFGVDVNISFDPALLSFNSAAAGSLLSNPLFLATPTSGSVAVSICCYDFSGGTGSSLFSASFDVNGAATPQITSISFATADLAVGALFEYQISPPLSADVQITSPVTAVPLPGTGVLFLTGIAILALFGRRAARYADTRLNFMFTSAQADGNA
jgi:hypothetical protein